MGSEINVYLTGEGIPKVLRFAKLWKPIGE